MLDVASMSLVNELNVYIQNRVEQNENKVILSSILDQNGKVAVEENKIVATLIDIHQETTLINNQPTRQNGDNGVVRGSPTIHLNLIMLFSAYFSVNNYKEGVEVSLICSIVFSREADLYSAKHARSPGIVCGKAGCPDVPPGYQYQEQHVEFVGVKVYAVDPIQGQDAEFCGCAGKRACGDCFGFGNKIVMIHAAPF